MRLCRFSASGTGWARARRLARVVAICLAPLLAGCWLRPDPPDLKLDVPDSYVTARKGPDSALPALDWWRGFGSRELTLLMEEAQTANLDIAVAVARIDQADAVGLLHVKNREFRGQSFSS